jgi:cellulase/cellobiase CelA1
LAVTPAMCSLLVPCSMKINTYSRRRASQNEVHAVGEPCGQPAAGGNIDGYLWIKPPGEADGCVYPAGSFVPGVA